MGHELPARVDFHGPDGEQSSEGKALLETSELIFRGGFRLRIPFREVQDLLVEDGRLDVKWPGGRASFDIGQRYAPAWAEKMRNPRGLLDKLGVKPGARVAVLGMPDQEFIQQLRARGAELAAGEAPPALDFVFYEADEVVALARLSELRALIKDGGAIWVVSPKGKAARVRDVDVIAAAKAARLVDTKVVGFSDTHTALKLVIPLAMRTKEGHSA